MKEILLITVLLISLALIFMLVPKISQQVKNKGKRNRMTYLVLLFPVIGSVICWWMLRGGRIVE